MKHAGGMAISALILSIVAFFFGLIPFLGIVLGAPAIFLGIVALKKRQKKALGVIAIVLGSMAVISSASTTATLLGMPPEVLNAAVERSSQERAEKAEQAEVEMAEKAAEERAEKEAKAAKKSAEEKAETERKEAEEAEALLLEAEKKAEEKAKAKKEADESSEQGFTEMVVPDVSGEDGKKAKESLEFFGFKVKFEADGKRVMVPGNWQVVQTTPGGDQVAKYGSTVTVHVKRPDSEDSNPTKNSQGLRDATALAMCKRYAESSFPYGVKIQLFGANQRLVDDKWILKTDITPKNQYGTEINGLVVECIVEGSDENPEVTHFMVS